MIILQGNGNTITLPNPDYPNSQIVNVKTNFKHAMSGLIYSTRYTQASKNFIIPLKGLLKNKLYELVDFLIATKGWEVTYIDEESVIRTGYITSDPTEFQSVEGGNLDYDVELTFEETN